MNADWILFKLRLQERDEYDHASAKRNGWVGTYVDYDDDWLLRSPHLGWRVDQVRSALRWAESAVVRKLAERLAELEVRTVALALAEACADIALVWGGSVLLGAGTGAALGSLAAGVGAVPGAALGAGLGAQLGGAILGLLGLAALVQDFGERLPQAMRHYERGLELAWGRPDGVFPDPPNPMLAGDEIAEGHVLVILALLSALAAYLTRGRGDPAARGRILQDIRQSRRLGPKLADWVEAHEDKLVRHPALQPRRQQQVTMAAALAKDLGPPVTPSQLRRAKAEAEGPPGRGRPPEPPKPPPRPPEPGRLPPKPVPCFHPFDKRKFRRMEPLQQREYLEAMARQLRRQEERINDLTAAQFKAARDNYGKYGRNPLAGGEQRRFGDDFAEDVFKNIRDSLRRSGLGNAEAERLAEQRTEQLTSKLAALHEPDMVAGGWLQPSTDRMGRADVNKAIGGSWNQAGRVGAMDTAAEDAIRSGGADAKMNVKLEVCRGKGLR
jgi:hypothetical protein